MPEEVPPPRLVILSLSFTAPSCRFRGKPVYYFAKNLQFNGTAMVKQCPIHYHVQGQVSWCPMFSATRIKHVELEAVVDTCFKISIQCKIFTFWFSETLSSSILLQKILFPLGHLRLCLYYHSRGRQVRHLGMTVVPPSPTHILAVSIRFISILLLGKQIQALFITLTTLSYFIHSKFLELRHLLPASDKRVLSYFFGWSHLFHFHRSHYTPRQFTLLQPVSPCICDELALCSFCGASFAT